MCLERPRSVLDKKKADFTHEKKNSFCLTSVAVGGWVHVTVKVVWLFCVYV